MNAMDKKYGKTQTDKRYADESQKNKHRTHKTEQ